MAISLKDKEVDGLAREVARMTGETLTETIRTALAERLARERLERGKPAKLADELEAIARRYDNLPLLDGRTDDEIIGYDEKGAFP